MFLLKMFLHLFHTHCSKYRGVLVKCCTKEITCTQAHIVLKNLGETLISVMSVVSYL